MCGRTACYLAPEDLSCACKYRDDTGKEIEVPWVPQKFQSCQYVPSYNMGPRDTFACIVAGSHFNESSERIFCPMMWGMIPPWHKGDYKKHGVSSHNGRLENLRSSKLYGKPLDQGKRCVVVISGFYEWQTNKQSNSKQPYYMSGKAREDSVAEQHRILTLAGLFDKWTSEDESIYSFTIITTAANDVLSWLHHRAPVVLQTDANIRNWLDYQNVSTEKALADLQNTNLSSTALQWYPVASTVNNVRYKDKSCIEQVSLGSKKTQNNLMAAWLKTGSTKINEKRNLSKDLEKMFQPATKKLKTN